MSFRHTINRTQCELNRNYMYKAWNKLYNDTNIKIGTHKFKKKTKHLKYHFKQQKTPTNITGTATMWSIMRVNSTKYNNIRDYTNFVLYTDRNGWAEWSE